MATFGGVNLFGTAVNFSIQDRPRECQINSYFGVNGIELLNGGSRGKVTTATGILLAPNVATLAMTETGFRNFADGIARDLVDNLGTVWPNVVLEAFEAQGRVRQSATGQFFRSYRARFLHLA